MKKQKKYLKYWKLFQIKIGCLEEREYTVSELNERIKSITMSALSQHLSQLKLAGIIESDKKGLNVYYRLNDLRILEVMKVLKKLYC